MTLAQLAEHFDAQPNQITEWNSQLLEAAVEVLDTGDGNSTSDPMVDVKTFHVKIGELKNDSSEGARQRIRRAAVPDTSTFAMGSVHTGALTAAPGSSLRQPCRSWQQPNSGRSSTYRRGIAVSDFDEAEAHVRVPAKSRSAS